MIVVAPHSLLCVRTSPVRRDAILARGQALFCCNGAGDPPLVTLIAGALTRAVTGTFSAQVLDDERGVVLVIDGQLSVEQSSLSFGDVAISRVVCLVNPLHMATIEANDVQVKKLEDKELLDRLAWAVSAGSSF